MNINPYANKYPGAGPMPQGNPSDGGQIGLGADLLGIQLRDWGNRPVLAKIANVVASTATGYVAPNQYGWSMVFAGTTGAITGVPNGIVTDGTTMPAFEANGSTAVPNGTIVEMYPQYSSYPAWMFIVSNVATAVVVGTTCKTVVVNVTCSGTNLVATFAQVRVIDSTCP